MDNNRLLKHLKNWFVLHFALDLLVALPLMAAPLWVLRTLGWEVVDPVAARLVSAALFAIGVESWLSRNGTLEAFRPLLNLKILWSAAAIVGILLNLMQNAQNRPLSLYLFLSVFLIFNAVWIYFRMQLEKPGAAY
jgi:hypothetical protein